MCTACILKYNVNVRTGNLGLIFVITKLLSAWKYVEHKCEFVIKYTIAIRKTNWIIIHYKVIRKGMYFSKLRKLEQSIA